MREKFFDKIIRNLTNSKMRILYDRNNRKYSLVNSILIDLEKEKIVDYDYKLFKEDIEDY